MVCLPVKALIQSATRGPGSLSMQIVNCTPWCSKSHHNHGDSWSLCLSVVQFMSAVQWWCLLYSGGACCTVVVPVVQWWCLLYSGGACCTVVVPVVQWWCLLYIAIAWLTAMMPDAFWGFIRCSSVSLCGTQSGTSFTVAMSTGVCR